MIEHGRQASNDSKVGNRSSNTAANQASNDSKVENR